MHVSGKPSTCDFIQDHNMFGMRVTSKLLLSLCALFTFTSFILIIVGTAGSTSNYKPINNVYIGEIDISHIKVSKLLPQTGPILAILTSAMKAPNASYEEIFGALRTISHSEALTPLMAVLSNSNNATQTLGALEVLAPLALNGNSSSTVELNAIYSLLSDSKDSNKTLDALSALVIISTSSSANSTAKQQQQQQVFELLGNSSNVTGTVDALSSLSSMSSEEKQQLTPVFTLFRDSDNLNSTLDALSTLMTVGVSSSEADQLFTALSQSNDIQSTLQMLQQSSSGEQREVIGAIATLLSSSSDEEQDLRILQSMVENNVTSSQTAKESFSDLTTLITSTEDPTLVLTTVSGLANSTGTENAQQLTALNDLISASNNQTMVLSVIGNLQESLSQSDESKKVQIEALFQLLYSSQNPTESFKALLELTAIAQSNPVVFTPILGLLDAASNSDAVVTEEDVNAIMPDILQYLNIAERFRLGIFTHCRVSESGKVLSCSNPYAVQGLDIKDILYTELENSDFRPYLEAMNISKDDIELVGKLPDREHEYEPAIKAVLALNILSIVCAFFLVGIIIACLFGLMTGRITRWIPRVLAMCVALFSVLSAIIAVVVTQIIKDGTSADGYNVVHKGGSAYYGLAWSAFALSFITMILLWFVKNKKKEEALAPGEIEEQASSNVLSEKQESSILAPTKV